ncbi:2235_t:CDS:2 [Funneliformis caledonium]|uniref:2235_t:CDS:1 n=1 Tax=Funneliformis caledonium TaxID=1117310 RepID=A0A9N8ZIM5_9GLOM|nr:2235_t:CDS:2 [Funneliformis caledonium]
MTANTRNLNKNSLTKREFFSYWNPLSFPTVNVDTVKKWNTQQLAQHLQVMFNVDGYCHQNLFNKDLVRKFREQQIDGKTFLKMTRYDFYKMKISGLLVLHLEAEIIRLHGSYNDDEYCEPEALLNINCLEEKKFCLLNQVNSINNKNSFQQLISRKLDKVPSIYDLRRFLSTPLPMRVPVPSCRHENDPRINSFIIPQNQCSDEGGNIISISSISLPFINALIYPRDFNSFCQESDLNSYIHMVDMLIQGTFNCLQMDRSQWLFMARNFIKSQEDLSRPSWMCWVNKHLLIHGEELPENIDWEVGLQRIFDKIHWKDIYYSQLPFKFIYISRGSKLRWYAFDPLRNKITKVTQDFDMDKTLDRLQIIRTVINIYSVLDSIKRNWSKYMIDKPTYPLYLSYNRDGNTTIEFMGNFVRKSLLTQRIQRFDFENLRELYSGTSHIKNLVHCVDLEGKLAHPTLTRDGICLIFLHPVGHYHYPRSEVEIKSAIKTILQVLGDMHQANWTHRDIYWGNILRQDNGEWLVIDLELGGPINEILQITLWNRWPEEAVTGKPYLACYDIYQVGRLLEDLKDSSQWYYYSDQFIHFKNFLLDAAKKNFTAEMALQHEWLNG